MSEIAEFEAFHPRAVKLLRKRKDFIVIASDEPYFIKAYSLIRNSEILKGTWTEEDERIYQAAQQQHPADALTWFCQTCQTEMPVEIDVCVSCGDARR